LVENKDYIIIFVSNVYECMVFVSNMSIIFFLQYPFGEG